MQFDPSAEATDTQSNPFDVGTYKFQLETAAWKKDRDEINCLNLDFVCLQDPYKGKHFNRKFYLTAVTQASNPNRFTKDVNILTNLAIATGVRLDTDNLALFNGLMVDLELGHFKNDKGSVFNTLEKIPGAFKQHMQAPTGASANEVSAPSV